MIFVCGISGLRHSIFASPLSRCACGAEDGTDEIVYFPELPSNSCLSSFEADKRMHASSDGCFNQFVVDYLFAGEKREVVQVRRLSGLLQREEQDGQALDVSLLKIDVEGGEAQVLMGIDDCDWSSIHQVAMEIHSDELLAECLLLIKPHYSRVWHQRQAIPGHHMLYAARGPGPGPRLRAKEPV